MTITTNSFDGWGPKKRAGQFPGPLIEARSGDHVEVNVYNGVEQMGHSNLSIHWHGLTMKGMLRYVLWEQIDTHRHTHTHRERGGFHSYAEPNVRCK